MGRPPTRSRVQTAPVDKSEPSERTIDTVDQTEAKSELFNWFFSRLLEGTERLFCKFHLLKSSRDSQFSQKQVLDLNYPGGAEPSVEMLDQAVTISACVCVSARAHTAAAQGLRRETD